MSISDLPEELLLKIFKFMKPHNLLETAQVSKTWSRVSRDEKLWEKIILTWKTLTEIENLDLHITRLIRMCPAVAVFKLDEVIAAIINPNKVIRDLIENCDNLEHLVLEGQVGIGLDTLELITGRWSLSLQTLSFGIRSLEKGVPNLGMYRKLTKLHFRIEFSTDQQKMYMPWAGREQEGLYMAAILDIPGLEELILEGFMWGFQTLSKGVRNGKLKKLKCLALRSLLVVGTENVVTIVESLKNLKYFEIDDSFDIEGEVKDVVAALQMEHPFKKFTSLPHLQL